MRRAIQIISLVLMLVLGVQSCAVSLGGSLSEELSETEAERQQAQDISGAGALGLLVALLWLIAGALATARPKASAWLFGIAAPMCALGAANGFTDLWIWMVASLAFAAASGLQARKHALRRATVEAPPAPAAVDEDGDPVR